MFHSIFPGCVLVKDELVASYLSLESKMAVDGPLGLSFLSLEVVFEAKPSQ